MCEVLSGDAREFGNVVRDALDDAGGFDVVRRAEADPSGRAGVGDLLGKLGVWDLSPSTDPTQMEAAAAACDAAGAIGLPYPVAERIAAAGLDDIDAVAHVDPRTSRLGHAGLGLRWLAIDSAGEAPVLAEGALLGTKLGPFAADVTVGEWRAPSHQDHLALLLTMQAWTLRGMARAAAGRTYAYVSERQQFGAPLSSFQGLRFALTDVEVQLQGLTESARYTLWSLQNGREQAWADALALRLTALEAAEVIFGICQQSHGAMGLCDESDISWLSRHSQVLRRLPWGRSRTESALLASLREAPLAGPFAA